MDKLNSLSYAYHYRNLDSTEYYARQAYALAASYPDGRAEALNNLAFVSIVRMRYDLAEQQLDSITDITNNQVELLVADVQQMRLCQRRSRNREFYDYRERADRSLRRIGEEQEMLSDRLRRRMIYAESEYDIVNSTYYYYVGLERQSIDALMGINPDGAIQQDVPQYLNYLYNVGSGGIITQGTQAEINQVEFDHLMRCYLLSRQEDYPFFTANAMEALAEHLMDGEARQQLMEANLPAMKFLNPENVDEDMLAGYLASASLDLFRQYGDIYQIAGAYRTLASCYRHIGDYQNTLFYLEKALSDSIINQAPDLVASIREQLSVAYSAIDDKPMSDYNRNIYIDLQEQTRQDRQLEARADQYDKTLSQLNIMLVVVVAAIMLLLFMLWLFNYLNQKQKKDTQLEELLRPLRDWQEENERQTTDLEERMEEISEDYALNVIHIQNSERRNLEQRAKVSLVNSVMPFIDRIIHEVSRLDSTTDERQRKERVEYVVELTDQINQYNDVLTHWIQLRQGELSLHIESFPVQVLFDMMARGKMSFQLKGIQLEVLPTEAVVKADRILTLFMLNTLADNARKFTPSGGVVTISATEEEQYVELSVKDTGEGMDQQQLSHLFDHKVIVDGSSRSHGFGLMNCKGIIEKYRKISQIFSVCDIAAESKVGEGSHFYFRLPKGMVRFLLALFVAVSPSIPSIAEPVDDLAQANIYADSAYFSNIGGTYDKTLLFADSCREALNRFYLRYHPGGRQLMLRDGDTSVPSAEIQWFHDSLPTNYSIILDIRNESAIAALALHEWQLYTYNNKIYTQLFKEMSADNGLDAYCRAMRQSQTNKTIAVIILVLVLLMILPAYYLLYYRHRLYYRFCVERIRQINGVLLSEADPAEKLERIRPLASEQYPSALENIVRQIQQALSDLISSRRQQFTNIELAEDERRRAQLEDNNLHISNSILDNCLSTLKHETMYYPSRIRQLVDEDDTQALNEVTAYYRELYAMLSQQAMRQTDKVKIHPQRLDNGILGDPNLIKYLFDILTRQSGAKKLDYEIQSRDDRYVTVTVPMPELHLDEKQAQDLFTPAIDHIPYLLCRQIVRDHGEATNLRGCGIQATLVDGVTTIRIILPKAK